MSKKVIPYKDSELGKKEQVTEMFDKVSSNYDFLNRVLTFGIDISWRKHVVALVKEGKAQKVLDIIDQDKLYLMIVNEQYFYLDCGYGVPDYVYKYIKRHIRKLYNLKLRNS